MRRRRRRSDAASRDGTRFRLFPQPAFLDAFHEPETVTVSTPAGLVGAGPSDDRMYVVDALGKSAAYGLQRSRFGQPFLYLPPWNGAHRAPVQPGPDGHFDHLQPGMPGFEAAHVYGVARFVLDVWEGYFGRRVQWHFARHMPRLELVLLDDWDNAQSGYGFIELGDAAGREDGTAPYGLNFDVLAHEMGHSIIYALVGVPSPATEAGEYFGFQESAADTVALLAALHFESVIDEVLASTRGNLYAANEMNRIAELSRTTQVRLASNSLRMDDFRHGWRDEHDLSMPLTGAVFDFLLDVFHDELLARGAIDRRLARIADTLSTESVHEAAIQARFAAAYARAPQAFRESLRAARDRVGAYLGAAWPRLSPHHFGYEQVAREMLRADREAGGRYQRSLGQNFDWRSIGRVAAGPRRPDATHGHSHSERTLTPAAGFGRPRSYRERAELAGVQIAEPPLIRRRQAGH